MNSNSLKKCLMSAAPPLRQSTLLLDQYPEVQHGFWGRHQKTARRDPLDDEQTRKSIACIASWFGCPSDKLIFAKQVHTSIVHQLKDPLPACHSFEGDGLITRETGVILSLRTADCVPILLYDPLTHSCAVFHVGWRGAFTLIIEQGMKIWTQTGIDPATVIVCLGPAIDQSHFEVNAEVRAQFCDLSSFYSNYFKSNAHSDTFQMDLKGIVVHQLRQNGVTLIDDVKVDTYGQEQDYFSYRRATHRQEQTFGNQISAVCLKPRV